jgi:hypothetical protein
LLQLYADGAQVPLAVRAQDGRDTGPLGASGVLEFYGQARDTRETDTRAYRLIVGDKPGLRIGPPARVAPGGDSGGKNATDTEPPATDSFSQTVERKDRSIYFAALDNGEERENFFGPVVNAAGAAQTLPVEQLDHTASYPARLEITLQGASDGPHRVRVSLNGQELGEVDFAGQQNRAARFEMPQSVLQEGDNQLSWQALGGAADVSLLDTARLTYARRYEATEGRLLLSTGARRHLRVSGFTTPNVRVFDVTEPRRVFQLAARVEADASGYTASLNSHLVNRLLLAVEDSRAHAPSRIVADEPSSWRDTNNAADFVILAPAAFRAAAEPLADARRAQGLLTVVVGLEDVYDEFSAGDADVNALRAFLRHAQTHWQRGPRYLLLLGDASLDPRNYLGLGARDYLPTGYVGTVFMETASDESLADLDGDGVAEIALGRLPASSPAQAQLQINKTLIYAPPASGRAVLVSDRPDGYDFASLNQTVRQQLPAGTPVTEIVRADDNATRQAVIAAFNQGPALVNYVGHGSVEVWTGAPIFNSADALALVNGPRLPLVVAMTCLNGYFQDLHTTSLAESLLNTPHGGAVAVWASSALTPADAQAPANRMFARSLYRDGARLGDAARAAKAAAPATDVRRTWILFGDPTLTAR